VKQHGLTRCEVSHLVTVRVWEVRLEPDSRPVERVAVLEGDEAVIVRETA
jgi:hypothetical protein